MSQKGSVKAASIGGCETKEYLALHKLYAEITRSIQSPLTLGADLFSAAFISQALHGNLSDLNNEERVYHLMKAVSLKVQEDSKNLYKFIDILVKEPPLRIWATRLRQECGIDDVDLHDNEPQPNSGDASQAVDTVAVVSCIKREMDYNFADLKHVFETSLAEVSAELFAAHLISNGTKKKPSYEAMIADFSSGLAFKKTLPLIVHHCKKLFSVFYKLGGPFADAGDSLKQSIVQSVSNELHLDLSFD